jgi:hypothetical protein
VTVGPLGGEIIPTNLPYTDFVGKIPHGIRQLSKLVSPGFTNWIYLVEGDNDYSCHSAKEGGPSWSQTLDHSSLTLATSRIFI